MSNLQMSIIFLAIIATSAALFYSIFQRLRDKNQIEDLVKQKGVLEEEKEKITEQINETESKNAEKSFKFIAINQMAKTLAKEKNTKMLKKLILDMLLETNSVMNGFSMENNNGVLELFEVKNLDKGNCNVKIDKNKDEKLWNFLKEVKVLSLENMKKYPKLSPLCENFKEGYWISFVTSNSDETEAEDVSFTVFLGDKTYGTYSDGEEEFLDTLCGQIEIVLENSLKNAYIKSKNDELTEKVYNLTILNYASKMVSSTLDVNEIFEKSVDMFAEASRSERAMIIYFDKDTEELEIKGIRGEIKKDVIGAKIRIPKEEINSLKEFKNIILLTEADENELMNLSNFYKKYQDIFKAFKHELFIPLIGKDEFMGAILLGMKYEDGYKQDNIEVYATLASQVSISLYNAKLYNLAITDGMTKLYLHRYFKSRLLEEVERAKRHERNVSLLMTDIDHFKKFNDTYGHQTGDEVLKAVANIIKESVRKTDIAARYGGEEFAVVLPETGEEGAKIVAENIRKKIESKVLYYNEKELRVTISIGVFTFENQKDLTLGEENVEMIVKKADKALYYSKESGRNRVTHFNQIKGYDDNEREGKNSK